ncbi:MAG TPA: SRPBCC family protein [Jatrophihabitans sp.]|nr:SRPBCC family protein [Jatrophihabitans sp.]
MEGEIISSFRESITIEAPPEVVWKLVRDIKRHPEFAGPKSITKLIDFEGEAAVGSRWIAHERVGPKKFDAPSEVTAFAPHRSLEWLSFPPMKDANRGTGGKVEWGYLVEAEIAGTRLTHFMNVLEPRKGAGMLKMMYTVFGLRNKQRAAGLTTLQNIKTTAEREAKSVTS